MFTNLKRIYFKDVLSVDTVHQFLLCLRDTQDYDGIIGMIDDLERIDQKQITHAQVYFLNYFFFCKIIFF